MSFSSVNPIEALNSSTGAGDYSLALKQDFNNLVQQQFIQSTPFWNGEIPLAQRKDVTGGREFRFLMRSRTEHTQASNVPAGDFIVGSQRAFAEDTITVDNEPLVSAQDYPIDQQMFASFDVMQGAASEVAVSLAMKFERRMHALALKAARTAAVTKNGLTIHNGGLRVTRSASANVATAYADSSTGSGNFRSDVAQLAYKADLEYVPKQGRYLVVHPYIARILRHETNIFYKEVNALGMSNSMNQRVIGELEGFTVVVDPVLQYFTGSSSLTGATYTDVRYSKYNVTCDGTEGIPAAIACWGSSTGIFPVGVATRQGVYGFMEFDEWTNVTKIKAQVMMGADVMHPWSAGEIAVLS